jgi:broad specificity phosphatase PhoE
VQLQRACDQLSRLKPPPAASVLSAVGTVGKRCDTREVQGCWWTRTHETLPSARARGAELLREMRASEHRTLVVVSHSKFLRLVLSEHLSDDGCEGGPLVAQALRKHNVPNCAVLICTLDADGERPLRDARLCWPPDAATRMVARERPPARKVAPE